MTVEGPSRFSCHVSTTKVPPDLQGLSRPDRESTTTVVEEETMYNNTPD